MFKLAFDEHRPSLMSCATNGGEVWTSRDALPAFSMVSRKVDSISTKAVGSPMACTESTGTGMRPLGSVSSAKSARACGSAA